MHETTAAWRLHNADFIIIEMFPRDFPRLPEQDPASPLQVQEGDAEATEHADATSPSTTEDSYQGPVTYVLHRPPSPQLLGSAG